MIVVDASVALKWFFGDRADEPDVVPALDILERFVAGELRLVSPAHFTLELCAVLAREAPETMNANLDDLLNLSIPVRDDPLVLARAMQLSQELDHHLFDTLYHAVALEEEDARLVTADRRYLRKAGGRGRVLSLADWTPS